MRGTKLRSLETRPVSLVVEHRRRRHRIYPIAVRTYTYVRTYASFIDCKYIRNTILASSETINTMTQSWGRPYSLKVYDWDGLTHSFFRSNDMTSPETTCSILQSPSRRFREIRSKLLLSVTRSNRIESNRGGSERPPASIFPHDSAVSAPTYCRTGFTSLVYIYISMYGCRILPIVRN